VLGSTCAPGRRRIRSTRPADVAVIQRISSGTSVPVPRISRTICPRCTGRIQSVLSVTPGPSDSVARGAPPAASTESPRPSQPETDPAAVTSPLPPHASEASVGCVISSPGLTQYPGAAIACRSPCAGFPRTAYLNRPRDRTKLTGRS
jgi:hypothetical protein